MIEKELSSSLVFRDFDISSFVDLVIHVKNTLHLATALRALGRHVFQRLNTPYHQCGVCLSSEFGGMVG